MPSSDFALRCCSVRDWKRDWRVLFLDDCTIRFRREEDDLGVSATGISVFLSTCNEKLFRILGPTLFAVRLDWYWIAALRLSWRECDVKMYESCVEEKCEVW